MAKKQYVMIIDTETTQDDLVADFGAVIVDLKGNIVNQCAVLVKGIFTDMENHPLFFDSSCKDGIWSRSGRDARYDMYQRHLDAGTRMVANVAAINAWLDKAIAAYDPVLTAYNLAFDLGKCANTGINLTKFSRSFCLWQAAFGTFAHTRKYRQFALEIHAFNAPTNFGNMSFKTNAETMTRFVTGNPTLENEPHTALEDAVYYELPILNALVKKHRSIPKIIDSCKPFNWRAVQVKEWFKAR